VADVSERGGELRDYGIEIVLKLAERFRQVVGDLTSEVLLGQLRQSRSQSLDGEPLDLGKSDDEILHATEAACAKDPGFMPREAFAAKVAARLAT